MIFSPRATTTTALALASIVGFLAFFWPFLADSDSLAAQSSGVTPFLFAVIMGLVLIVVLAQISMGHVHTRTIALLGLLIALITALRPLGAGLAGIEPIWVVVIVGGCAFGPAFGFTLGSVSLFTSALVTAGVGPWLPFQMVAAGWIGMLAGLLARSAGKSTNRWILAGFGAGTALLYGLLLNAWFWPTAVNLPQQLAFIPGAALAENAVHLWRFTVTTSLGFDIPRALLTAVVLFFIGVPFVRLLQRGLTPASFHPPLSAS